MGAFRPTTERSNWASQASERGRKARVWRKLLEHLCFLIGVLDGADHESRTEPIMHLPFPFLRRAGHPHVPPGTTPQMGRHHVLLVGPATLVPLVRSALATEGPHVDATDKAWLGRTLATRYAYDLIVVDRPSDA